MNLLSTRLQHNILLTLINAAFSSRPKLQNDVFLFQQLIQCYCNTNHKHSAVCTCMISMTSGLHDSNTSSSNLSFTKIDNNCINLEPILHKTFHAVVEKGKLNH